MANSPQAKKRARQAEKHRLQNQGQRSKLRTHIKRVVSAIEAGDKEAATAAYNAAVPVIDTLTVRGLIHKNKAARHKSRLNAHLKSL